MSITSNTQCMKIEREVSLARKIKSRSRVQWSEMTVSLRPEDHPTTKLSNGNLPFVVKISIDKHKVAKTLSDNGLALNLIMRYSFLEMKIPLL
jgi:hypothetical protein